MAYAEPYQHRESRIAISVHRPRHFGLDELISYRRRYTIFGTFRRHFDMAILLPQI